MISWILLTFSFGLIIALAAQSWEKTSLTACINGSISLPGDDSRRLAEQSWWKARYQDDSWIKIGFCARTKGCTTSTRVLTDGTRLWIGRNRTLFVTHTAGNQKNATQQLQFLREDDLDRRHIYVVNFTVHCTCTRPGANLNLSQVVLRLYPMKDFVEVYLLDTSRTRFAQIHSDKGASLRNESHSPMIAFWNRLKIERGSLIFLEINATDNGTTIILQALLNSEQTITRLGFLSRKTMRIFVCNSAESTSSSSTPGPTSKPAKTTHEPAGYKQRWAIICIILLALVRMIIAFIIFLIQKMNHRSSESSVVS